MLAIRFRVVLPLALGLVAASAASVAAKRSHGEAPHVAPPAPSAPALVRAPAHPVKPAFDPIRAWNTLGCVGCHGDDGVFKDEITGAIGKPVEQVGRWIRNAPSVKPDTDMPRFEGQIDVADSEVLAAWVLKRAEKLAAESKNAGT